MCTWIKAFPHTYTDQTMISPKIQFQLWCVNFTAMLSFFLWLVQYKRYFCYFFSVFCGKISVRMRTYSNWFIVGDCQNVWYIPFGWYSECFRVISILIFVVCEIQSASNQIEWFTGFVFLIEIAWNIAWKYFSVPILREWWKYFYIVHWAGKSINRIFLTLIEKGILWVLLFNRMWYATF